MSDWNGKNSGLVPDRMKQAAEITASAIIYFSQANGGEADDCGVYFSELCKYIGGDAGFFERFISVFSEAAGAAVPNGVPRLDGAGKIAALFGQVMSVAGKTPNEAGNVPLYGTDLALSETESKNVTEALCVLNSDKADTFQTSVLEGKRLVYAGAGDFCALIRFGANVPAVNASLRFDGSGDGLVFAATGNVRYTDPAGAQYPVAVNGAWAASNARWDSSTRTFSLGTQGTITAKSGDLPPVGDLLWHTQAAVDPRYNFEKARELKERLTAVHTRAEANAERITQAEADLEKETENRVQTDGVLDKRIEETSDGLTSHTDALDNPHQVSLSQAAAQQQTEDAVLQGNLFKGGVTEGNKFVTRAEVTAMGIDSMRYKGQLKYGAATLADRGNISGMAVGDICGVQTTQAFYQWDGAAWREQAPGADETGDVWDIVAWYGVWNNVVYMGDVTATIKCRDGVNRLWDLIVNADFIRDGEITDNAVGTRTLLDNAEDGTLIAITAKKLTAWLQGLRNNLKWLFARLKAHIADAVIHVTAADRTEWFAKYNKPAAGVPLADLTEGVQASLGKADESATALSLEAETERATGAETDLQGALADEAAARADADEALQTALDAEAQRARAAEAKLDAGKADKDFASKTSAYVIGDVTSAYVDDKTINIKKTAVSVDKKGNAKEYELNLKAADHIRFEVQNETDIEINIDEEIEARTAAETALAQALTAETTRAQAAEAENARALTDEAAAREDADAGLETALAAETAAREDADADLQTALAAETAAREDADAGLETDIDTIAAKIPAQATSANQLADKNFVNSSIQSITAFPVYKNAAKANFLTKQELVDAETAYYADGTEVEDFTNNYAIVVSDESAPAPFTGGQTRYKFSGASIGSYGFEYGVNETPFTAAQNAAIDSGITAAKVADILGKSEVEAGYTPEGTLDINGVTGYTEMNDGEEISLYSHYLKIRVMNGNDFVIWFGGVIFLNDAAPFTATSFFQWLAAQNFTTEARAFPINGRYTTNGSSSLDAGAVWINAAATQISLTTIASSGTATQNITLSGKTITVDDFVQPAPFNIASHRHSFAIEDMSGGFSGVPAPRVVQTKAPDAPVEE